jgi:hypothetical protein
MLCSSWRFFLVLFAPLWKPDFTLDSQFFTDCCLKPFLGEGNVYRLEMGTSEKTHRSAHCSSFCNPLKHYYKDVRHLF